jgi:hypothetical protein
MKRYALLFAVLFFACAAWARDPFSDVVRAIEQESGVHHTGIPWYARIFVGPALKGSGMQGVKLAAFESEGRPFHVDEVRVSAAIQRSLGPEWQKFVEVRSRRDHETVLIYARSGERGTTMLIVSLESNEGAVVEVNANLEQWGRWLSDPEEMGRGELKHKGEKSADPI